MKVGLRINIKESTDRVEMIRILQDNGYECRLVNDTATLDPNKRQFVYLEMESK